ncbi:hypothetical protein KP509_06G057500 [Ceratopteris richardii]|nr:hypothetical protein KP509_06G057500 [Ceratopteris richardii]
MINTAVSMSAIREVFKSAVQFFRNIRLWRTQEVETAPTYPPQDDPPVTSRFALPSLSDEIRASLPVSSYESSMRSSEEPLDHTAQCAICLLDFVEGDGIHRLPRCDHIFHQGCLSKWLDHQQNTCPLCRASLVSDDLQWRYRRREQELVEELILWFSSFHGSAFHGLWWQA